MVIRSGPTLPWGFVIIKKKDKELKVTLAGICLGELMDVKSFLAHPSPPTISREVVGPGGLADLILKISY